MKRVLVVALASLAVACGSTPARSGTSSATTTSTGGNGSGAGNGSGTSSANGSSGSGSTSASSGLSGASGSSGVASSGSGGNTTGSCYTDTYVGLGNGVMCCSGQTDASGYCIPPGASTTGNTTTGGTSNGTTGTGSTTGATTSGTATGSTTGGTCPSNVPNLVTGQGGYNAGACSTDPTKPACPKGYHCDNGQCALNTSSTLQVTLSFDDIEDFDLHLMEPLGDGGYCEIYYGNPGNAPDSGFNFPFDAGFGGCPIPGFCNDGGFTIPGGGTPCPAGWLDLDTNAACGGNNNNGGAHPDGVNIENILFQNGQQPPPGTYTVRVDYWENCDQTTCNNGQDSTACNGHPSSDLSVQVRLPSSAIYQYCPAISTYPNGPNDQGDNGGQFPDGAGAGSGFFVTSFTIP